MSDDSISRKNAIDAVSKACEELRGVFGRCEDAIKALPAVEPERKRGRWLNHLGLPLNDFCSVCAKDSPYNKHWDFCPNCGADMRGDKNETD